MNTSVLLLLLLTTPSQESAERLLLAVRSGDAAEVRAALVDGVDVDEADYAGRTALMVAVSRDDEAMVKLLLEAGADATKRNASGIGALTLAKAESSPAIVTLLRNAGARESLEERLDEAIRSGALETVSSLIEEGADVDALDTDAYQTPLMTALELRELDIFLRLVEAGADPTREGTGFSTTGDNAITVAARQGSPWALRLLLASRARKVDLDRALMLGCANAAVVRAALEAGANVQSESEGGATPLMCAASAGAVGAITALLEAGADIDATDDDGGTARDRAQRNGFDDVVLLLSPR